MIQLVDLSFRYAGQSLLALDSVSFEAQPGGPVLLSGPTGCGKSTLGLILCNAIPNLVPGELSGSVRVGEVENSGRTIRETSRDLGYLLQNVEYQTFTETVLDEIAFGLENFGIPEQQIAAKTEEALSLVNGNHLRNRRIATLSAGERQRIMLAALLAMDQQVLVLDEPLAYLDIQAQQSFVEMMGHLAGKGKTLLIFEHRRDAMSAAVRYEIYMNGGKIQDIPTIQRVFPKISAFPLKEAVLRFTGVNFSWDLQEKEPLLKEIDLEVRQHESVVLLGQNGCGKTTLMQLAMGLLKPQSGSITTCGLDPDQVKVAEIARRAAIIFQRPDHQLHLPYVYDEVRAQTVDRNRVGKELAALGLDGLERRHPQSLSMGQKRRLTIAAALARKPQLLLLDEPSVGQDDASLARIIERLETYLAGGGAILTATHDARVARALAHRTLELSRDESGVRDVVPEKDENCCQRDCSCNQWERN